MPKNQRRMIRNNSSENKSPPSGSHSSPLPHTTSIASDLFHDSVLFSFSGHVREGVEERRRRSRKRKRKRKKKTCLENISNEIINEKHS